VFERWSLQMCWRLWRLRLLSAFRSVLSSLCYHRGSTVHIVGQGPMLQCSVCPQRPCTTHNAPWVSTLLTIHPPQTIPHSTNPRATTAQHWRSDILQTHLLKRSRPNSDVCIYPKISRIYWAYNRRIKQLKNNVISWNRVFLGRLLDVRACLCNYVTLCITESKVAACDPPCMNGGTCYSEHDHFTPGSKIYLCYCTEAFHGLSCEKERGISEMYI